MICECYHAERNFIGKIGVCWGTKECEACSCGGDERICDFYESKREKGQDVFEIAHGCCFQNTPGGEHERKLLTFNNNCATMTLLAPARHINNGGNPMNIVTIYPENPSKKVTYTLTMSPKMRNMKELKGSTLEVSAWCKYEDVDAKTGELRPILSIMTPEGEVFGTNSATFIDDFEKMAALFGPGGVDAIEVVSGTSKAGREFITCAYAGE